MVIFSFRIGSPQVWCACIVRPERSKHPYSFVRVCVERKRRRERKEENIIEEAELRRRTLGSALGVESPESGRVPWVRLESVVRCTMQTVRSSGENIIYDEGTLPLGLELVLLLLR